jgi:hypothetical protein
LNPKLSAADVAAVRKLYATGKFTQVQLGLTFNVNPGHISRIVNRQTWTNAAPVLTMFERIAANARA